MERKIFKKSDKSRIRLDLNFEQYYWGFRSAHNTHKLFVGFADDYGCANYSIISYDYDILPVCTI